MRRFAYAHRMLMVLADAKHFRAGIGRLRRLALLDDATRYGLGVLVGTSESTELFLRALRPALLRYGLMAAFFLNRGPGLKDGGPEPLFTSLASSFPLGLRSGAAPDTARQEGRDLFLSPGDEAARHARAAHTDRLVVLIEWLETPGVPARAHPDEHLLDGLRVERILFTEFFPGRQFYLAALDASNARPREADLPTCEDEGTLRGSVPEGLAIRLGLAPGAAQHRLGPLRGEPGRSRVRSW